MILHASLKISSVQAMWMFIVTEQDHSWRFCGGVRKLFQNILSDSDISKEFTISRQMVSYVASDGLRLLLGKRLCNDTGSSEETFLMRMKVKS